MHSGLKTEHHYIVRDAIGLTPTTASICLRVKRFLELGYNSYTVLGQLFKDCLLAFCSQALNSVMLHSSPEAG